MFTQHHSQTLTFSASALPCCHQHLQLRSNGYNQIPNRRQFADLKKVAGITDAELMTVPRKHLQNMAICNAGFQINTTCYHR